MARRKLRRERGRPDLHLPSGQERQVPQRRSGGRGGGALVLRAHPRARQGAGLDAERVPQGGERPGRGRAYGRLHPRPAVRALHLLPPLVVRHESEGGHGPRSGRRHGPEVAHRPRGRLRPVQAPAGRARHPLRAGAGAGLLEGPQGIARRHHLQARARVRGAARGPHEGRGGHRDGPEPRRVRPVGQGAGHGDLDRARADRLRHQVQHPGREDLGREPPQGRRLRLRLRRPGEDLQRPGGAPDQPVQRRRPRQDHGAEHAAPRPSPRRRSTWPSRGGRTAASSWNTSTCRGWRKSA